MGCIINDIIETVNKFMKNAQIKTNKVFISFFVIIIILFLHLIG